MKLEVLEMKSESYVGAALPKVLFALPRVDFFLCSFGKFYLGKCDSKNCFRLIILTEIWITSRDKNTICRKTRSVLISWKFSWEI